MEHQMSFNRSGNRRGNKVLRNVRRKTGYEFSIFRPSKGPRVKIPNGNCTKLVYTTGKDGVVSVSLMTACATISGKKVWGENVTERKKSDKKE